MKRISISFFALFMAFSLSAQKKDKALTNGLKEGDRLFNKFDFAAAADQYNSLVFKYPDNIEATLKAARSYVLAGNHAGAETVYASAVKLPNAPADIHFYYAQELAANGKYEEADAEYTTFIQGNPNDPRAKEFSGFLGKISALQNVDSSIKISNFKYNTAASDIAPVFCDKYIVFASTCDQNNVIVNTDESTNSPFYKLYASNADTNGNWLKPRKWKALDKSLNASSVSFSANGNEVYFTASNRSKGKAKLSKTKQVNLKIYHAVLGTVKKKWTNIRPLPFCSSEYSVAQPSLSADGKRLFFVSDMPGGYGETDIYVSYRDGATWGKPINLGKNINTFGSELYPFCDRDNVLYFASDNHLGLGGLDIYVSEFGAVRNLGAPLNSQYDDFAYFANNNSVYFSSNRSGGKGSDDIYSFSKPQEKRELEVKKMPITKEIKEVFQRLKEAKKEFQIADTPKVAVAEPAVKINGDTTQIAVIETSKAEEPKVEKTAAKAEISTPKVDTVVTPKSEIAAPKIDTTLLAEIKEAIEIGTPTETSTPKAPKIDTPKTVPVLPRDFHLSVLVQFTHNKELATGAVITLINKTTGTQWTNTVKNATPPTFTIVANQTYQLCVSRQSDNPNGSYATHCETFTTNGIENDLTDTINLTYLEVGAVVKEDVHFDFNKFEIKQGEEAWLDRIVENMQQFKKLKLEITSHTDCKGDAAYNLYLSQERLKSILNWLSAHKVDMTRIVSSAYGETKPAVNCECDKCTDEENKANRRVEIRILKLK